MNTGFAQAQQEHAALRCGSPRVATKIAELFCVLCLVPAQEWYIIRPGLPGMVDSAHASQAVLVPPNGLNCVPRLVDVAFLMQ